MTRQVKRKNNGLSVDEQIKSLLNHGEEILWTQASLEQPNYSHQIAKLLLKVNLLVLLIFLATVFDSSLATSLTPLYIMPGVFINGIGLLLILIFYKIRHLISRANVITNRRVLVYDFQFNQIVREFAHTEIHRILIRYLGDDSGNIILNRQGLSSSLVVSMNKDLNELVDILQQQTKVTPQYLNQKKKGRSWTKTLINGDASRPSDYYSPDLD